MSPIVGWATAASRSPTKSQADDTVKSYVFSLQSSLGLKMDADGMVTEVTRVGQAELFGMQLGQRLVNMGSGSKPPVDALRSAIALANRSGDIVL